ncbi:MAG: hypothetical protein JWM28_2563 [Chitinophagaceae bacterium]|nr:hypothetical protein [Chitinophagaceae bacterium]
MFFLIYFLCLNNNLDTKKLLVRKSLSLALVALIIHSVSQAQTIRRPAASYYIGYGAYGTTHTDPFSFISNQATLAKVQRITGGIYSERRFMLNELSHYYAVIALPTHSGNFGFKAGYYGFNDYNETQAGLAYGKSLDDKIDIGVQFNYYAIKVAGYGSAAAINFEVGILLHLTGKLNAGIHVYNPVGGKFGKNSGEKLPFIYTTGFGYEASDKFLVSAEMQKEEDQPVNINAGIQYKLLPLLLARAGISTATSNSWLGIGVLIKSLRIDVTAGYHPQLGVTPGLLLLFNMTAPVKDEENTQ